MALKVFAVDLQGTAELRKQLQSLATESQKAAVVEAAEAGGKILQEEMIARAPKEKPGPEAKHPGLLKSDIQLKISTPAPGVAVAKVGPGKKGFYGFFLEVGTRFMAAIKFILPTYTEKGDAAGGAAIAAFEKFLAKETGGPDH